MSLEFLAIFGLLALFLGTTWFANRNVDKQYEGIGRELSTSVEDMKNAMLLAEKQLELQTEISVTLKEIKTLLEDGKS